MDRPFFFLHIRKTAGVSLRGLLANRFPVGKLLFQAHSVGGPQDPGQAVFATGHVGFDYAQRFRTWPTIFTMLREPVSRSLSAYRFFQNHSEAFYRVLATELSPADYDSRRRFSEHARSLGMRRFLRDHESLARTWLSNVQTRQLAGAACAGLADDDPRLIETALHHFGSIDLVGIFERLDQTLHLLGRLTNWGSLGPVQHLNMTGLSDSDPDPACLEILRSWNELDSYLYDAALARFETQLAALDDASAKDIPTSASSPIEGDLYTPDQPIHGYGWHEREWFQGKWLCWNSAPIATLNLRPARSRPSTFRCLLSHAISEAVLEHLAISVNSMPLRLQKRAVDGGILVEGDIVQAAWATDSSVARLTFTCPVMGRPCDVDPASTDRRNLGVALAWLRME